MSVPSNVNPDIANPIARAYCQRHGDRPLYIVCSCVLLFGERVEHVERPTRKRAGEILCKREADHEPFEYRPICDLCAINLGISNIGGKRIA